MNKNILALSIVVVILILGGFYFVMGKGTNPNLNQNLTKTVTPTQTVTSKEIKLTATGFEPKTVTVKQGTMVRWVNESGKDGTVNSDPYPYNSMWKFLNLGTFPDKSGVSLIFDKVGVYTYHNQLSPDQTGTINVTK